MAASCYEVEFGQGNVSEIISIAPIIIIIIIIKLFRLLSVP